METFAPSFESTHLKNPEQELAFLRERLAAKEQEVAAMRREKPETPEVHQEKIAEETIQEYKEAPHHQVLHKDYVMPKEQSEAIVLELAPEKHDEKIAELLGIMQTHGIKNAHQFIAQLEEGIRDSVFGNVGSIAAFRVGAEDAEYLEKQFAPVFTAKDIMSIDNRNAYLKMLANGRPVKPFNIETLPPPQGNKAIVDQIKELSYLTHGKDRVVVEEEIMKKYSSMKA